MKDNECGFSGLFLNCCLLTSAYIHIAKKCSRDQSCYRESIQGQPSYHKADRRKQKFIPVFVILSILQGTLFKPSEVIFSYSQILISHIAPMTSCVFLFALFSRRTPAIAACISTVLGIPLILFSFMAETLAANPEFISLKFSDTCNYYEWDPILFPSERKIDHAGKLKAKFERNLIVVIWGIFILSVTAIYVIFAE